MNLLSRFNSSRTTRSANKSRNTSASQFRKFFADTDIQLESRELLAINPGTVYQSANYIDAMGNRVDITVTGAVVNPQLQGFTVELAGLATDNADATTISLQGLGKTNGVQIVVTPVEQPNAGPNFNRIFSSGYTNVGWIKSADSTMTDLGGIQMSAAIVNSIQLADVSIGNITLDPGQAPYVDRINTTNNQQSLDSTKYQSVTGLIHMGGINAAKIDSLVINGAISNITGNPYSTATTNDFRSVINVSGRIGSIVGLRSNMAAAVYAGSIGSVRVAAINGILKTTDPTRSFYINMPGTFNGFIDVAGHLDIGFPMSSAALITGTIISHGGISGTLKSDPDTNPTPTPDPASLTDPIYLPGDFVGSLTNESAAVGIADVNVDGIAGFQLSSKSNIGNLYAGSFGGAFIAEAGKNIGNVTANSGELAGHFNAGSDIFPNDGNIGQFSAVAALNMNILAAGNVGDISSLTGLMESQSIQAGGNIGRISTYLGINQTSFVAGGDIGPFKISFGDFANAYVRASNIRDINIVDGSVEASSFIASNDIGNMSSFGSLQDFGMEDVSLVAGRDIGQINAFTHIGEGMSQVKIDAGRNIAGITGKTYGEFGERTGSGMIQTHIVAGGNIGPVLGYSSGGTGMFNSTVVTRPHMAVDGTIDRSVGSIASITGDGWLDGLRDVVAVAHTSIGAITGRAINNGSLDKAGLGSGISGGSYDANYGSIGQIIGEGAATDGWGIQNTRFQATDKDNGRIQGLTASGNANGLGAMSLTNVYAGSIGPIVAVVHGGLDGIGIDGGEIRAYWGNIDSININVRSINGVGLQDTIVRSSLDIGTGKGSAGQEMGVRVVAFNNSAILRGDFQARGNFGPIYAESTKAGNAIDQSTFSAPGRTFFLPDDRNEDPYGRFSTITAIASGSAVTDNAITRSTFTAIGNIEKITARSRGGYAIIGSNFTADSDNNYDPNSSIPQERRGNIGGIEVEAAGRNLISSTGIDTSTFTAANIGDIKVDVTTVEGGDAISGSTFTARTSVYDGKGNFNNTGSIGNITIDNKADQQGVGEGIYTSTFSAGPAGTGIGNITVTCASGAGISTSTFDASVLASDVDQELYSSKIGNITVKTGRNNNFTLLPSGIALSTFTAAAGIGNITVDSIGTGITGSVFTADFDWKFNNNVEGNIGNITVRVPGRFGSGIVASTVNGSNIGNIYVSLVDMAAQGIWGIGTSNFTAWKGSIGNVTVIHSQAGTPYALGLGYAIFTSTFTAQTSIGAITIQGRTLGAVFIVNGQVIFQAVKPASIRATSVPVGSIGPVDVQAEGNTDLTFQTNGALGNLNISNVPAAASVKLNVTAASQGNLVMTGVTGQRPAMNLTTSATSLGNISAPGDLNLTANSLKMAGQITSGGNASIKAAALTTAGDLNVSGNLNVNTGLPALAQIGSFNAGSLSAISKKVWIGSKGLQGSSIGPINIGSIAKGKGEYQFAFSQFTGTPNATIGGKSANAKTGAGQALNGARLILTASAPAAAAKSSSVKSTARSK
ncbi:MAG: beta strand repeat-containing protein [Isosphaeraceae bacterium]